MRWLICSLFLLGSASAAVPQVGAGIPAYADDVPFAVRSQLSPRLQGKQMISSYQEFDTDLNRKAYATFTDSSFAEQRQTAAARGGERRIYIKSTYVLGRVHDIQKHALPLQNDSFLVNVAKGHRVIQPELQPTPDSHPAGLENSEDQNLNDWAARFLRVSESEKMNQCLKESARPGPAEESSYTTRSYDGVVDYEQLHLNVVQYNTYDEYLGQVYQGRVTEAVRYVHPSSSRLQSDIVWMIKRIKPVIERLVCT
ncbi:hypothetical protein Q5741_04405 [Paenibacillus sp. JX-17]|uniref:Secreted protein n=1 Tax=Paenibacillus lacisoli TaxID=3064525 RepID=A0ABT9CCD9_9BACL|nr:hypothetical protein [Paenibacillus sp. JX-17]MDO7905652.1 hypothetical protein [Paenibacillus sp. JX-17]